LKGKRGTEKKPKNKLTGALGGQSREEGITGNVHVTKKTEKGPGLIDVGGKKQGRLTEGAWLIKKKTRTPVK